MTVEPMGLHEEDAVELGEMFIAGWLKNEADALSPSLHRHVGSDAYGIEELRDDVRRFEFLLGGGDGCYLLEDDED